MTSWDLEGSNDDSNWIVLRSHKNDMSLLNSKTNTMTYVVFKREAREYLFSSSLTQSTHEFEREVQD